MDDKHLVINGGKSDRWLTGFTTPNRYPERPDCRVLSAAGAYRWISKLVSQMMISDGGSPRRAPPLFERGLLVDQLTFLVPAEYDGATVQTFLRRGCGFFLPHAGPVPPGGGQHPGGWRAAAPSTMCRQDKPLVLRLPEDTVRVEPVEYPLEVVYGDGSLLVVNKPPYLAVHPSAGNRSLPWRLPWWVTIRKKGNPAFRPLGRLDRNTSGLLAAARNAHGLYALGGGKIQKEYRALALGKLEGEGIIDAPHPRREGELHHPGGGEGEGQRDSGRLCRGNDARHLSAGVHRHRPDPSDTGTHGLAGGTVGQGCHVWGRIRLCCPPRGTAAFSGVSAIPHRQKRSACHSAAAGCGKRWRRWGGGKGFPCSLDG